MRVLVVEDARALAEVVAEGLRDQGMAVDVALDGLAAAAKLDVNAYEVVVLDRDLPGIHGDTLCQMITERDDRPMVLMLTAAGAPGDRVSGLTLGADDYLAKPFNPRELLARIKAVLRRQAPLVPGAPASEDEVVTFGDYQLSLATRELKKGDQVHMLTTGEFAVLKALVQHAREPLTRDKLMNLARGREWDALERSIDVQISRLRRMIEPDPSKPRYIQTVWGVGYVFVPDGVKA